MTISVYEVQFTVVTVIRDTFFSPPAMAPESFGVRVDGSHSRIFVRQRPVKPSPPEFPRHLPMLTAECCCISLIALQGLLEGAPACASSAAAWLLGTKPCLAKFPGSSYAHRAHLLAGLG